MKKLLALYFMLLSASMFSQDNGALQGNITDLELNGEPLLFANVSLKNTLLYIQTNLHGNFNFTDIVPGVYTVVVSFPGYENLEFQVLVEENKTTFIQKGLHVKTIDIERILQEDVPVVTNSDTPTVLEANF